MKEKRVEEIVRPITVYHTSSTSTGIVLVLGSAVFVHLDTK